MSSVLQLLLALLLRNVLSSPCPSSAKGIQVLDFPKTFELTIPLLGPTFLQLPSFEWAASEDVECGQKKLFFVCTGCGQNMVAVDQSRNQLIFESRGAPGQSFTLKLTAIWPNGVKSSELNLEVKFTLNSKRPYTSERLNLDQEAIANPIEQSQISIESSAITTTQKIGALPGRGLQIADCQVFNTICSSSWPTYTYNVGDGATNYHLPDYQTCFELSPSGCTLTLGYRYFYWGWEYNVALYRESASDTWFNANFETRELTIDISDPQSAGLWSKTQGSNYMNFYECYYNNVGGGWCVGMTIYVQGSCPLIADPPACDIKLSNTDKDNFLTCSVGRSCVRYFTLESAGPYPWDCIRVQPGSFIALSQDIDTFAALQYIDPNNGYMQIMCNQAGSGSIEIQYQSFIDQCTHTDIITITCTCLPTYSYNEEYAQEIYSSCLGLKSRAFEWPMNRWAPQDSCTPVGGKPDVITDVQGYREIWMNFTPVGQQYSGWITYYGGYDRNYGQNQFESQTYGNLDLPAQTVSLDFCDHSQTDVRWIYIGTWACCYSTYENNYMTGQMVRREDYWYGQYVAFQVYPPPDCLTAYNIVDPSPSDPVVTAFYAITSEKAYLKFITDNISYQTQTPFYCGAYDFAIDSFENQFVPSFDISLVQDGTDTYIQVFCQNQDCIGRWQVTLKVTVPQSGQVSYPQFYIQVLCQSDSLVVDQPHATDIANQVYPTYTYRLCSGTKGYPVSTLTQVGLNCGYRIALLLNDAVTGVQIQELNWDVFNPLDPVGGWIYATSDAQKIVVDNCADRSTVDFTKSQALIKITWSQNQGITGSLEITDGFYLHMLPDCNSATLIPPTFDPIIISSELPNTQIAAFNDNFSAQYGNTIQNESTCGLRNCWITDPTPYLEFDSTAQIFTFKSQIDKDVANNYQAELNCQLLDYPSVSLQLVVDYQVLPCSYSSLTTDNLLTGIIVAYEYASGQKEVIMDSIATTSPACLYSQYTYGLNVVPPSTEDLVSLGLSIDNSQQPAKLLINQPAISSTKTVTLEWYAVPTGNPSQPTFPKQFQISYTNPCDSATFTSPTLSDITLTYLGPQLTFTFDPFTDSISTRLGLVEACGPWTYSISSSRADETNFSLTKVDVRTWTLSYSTLGSYTVGVSYPLVLDASINGVLAKSEQIQLYLNPCVTTSLAFISTNVYHNLDTISYKIGDQLLSFQFELDQTPACGYAFTYSYQVDTLAINTAPAWLTPGTYLTPLFPKFDIYSVLATDAGSYSVLVKVSILDSDGNPNNYLDQSIAVTIVMNDPCLSATWNTQAIAAISQPVLSPLFSQTFSAPTVNTGTLNAVSCGAVTYNLVPALSFLSLDTSAYAIKVQTTDLLEVNTYTVKLVGSLDLYVNSVAALEIPFQVDIVLCKVTSITVDAANAILSGDTIQYMIGDPTAVYTFYFSQSPSCQIAYSFTYTVNSVASPVLAWISFSDDGSSYKYPSITVQTSDTQFAGTYAVEINTILNDGTTTFQQAVPFTIEVTDPCSSATWSVSAIQDMTTSILVSPVLSPQIFSAFGLNTAVNCGSITYVLDTSLAFVTVSSIDRSITVDPSLPSQVGSYLVNIKSTLDNYPSVVAGASPFTIYVNPCLLTSITATTVQPTTFTYLIGDPAIFISQEYAQSPLCNYAFTYSYSVDGVVNPGLTWLTTSTTTSFLYPQVSVVTSDTSYAGTHAFQLTTSINDGTNTLSDIVSFDLILNNPCLSSPWSTVTVSDMVTSVLVNPSLAPQVFTQFSLTTSVLCGAVDYTLSPALAFVSLDSAARSISVVSFTQSEAGTNSMTLTGTLTNYPSISLSKAFLIIINPCILTSASVVTTGFGFTQTVTIFDVGYSFLMATYSQTPTCGYTPIYTYEADTVPSSGYQSKAFYFQQDSTTLRVSSSDYSLDGQTFTLRQQTQISTTVLTQTAQITFQDPCKTTQFVPQIISSAYAFITPDLTPVTVILPILSDTVSVQYPSGTTPTCYTQNVVVTSNGNPISFMTTSTSADGQVTLTFASNSVLNQGKFVVDVLYSLTRYPTVTKIVSFDLYMYLLSEPTALNDQTYVVGQAEKTIESSLFQISPITSSLTFSYISTLENGDPLPSFISGILNQNSYSFSVYSSQSNDVGTYQIKLTAVVTGTGQSTSLSTSFQFTVSAPPPSIVVYQPPYFVQELILDHSAFVGEAWEYQLPDFEDPQQSLVTLSVILSTASIFMSFDSGKLSILQGTTQETNIGIYQVQIKLLNDLGAALNQIIKFEVKAAPVVTDQDVTNQSQTEQTTNGETGTSTTTTAQPGSTVIIPPSEQSKAAMAGASESAKQTFSALASAPTLLLKGGSSFNWADAFAKTQSKAKVASKTLIPSDVSIKRISDTGQVTLAFNTIMINAPVQLIQEAKFYNKTMRMQQPAILINVLPSRYSDLKNLTFTYNVTSYTPTTLTIQLNFQNPSIVSSFAEPDSIQIQFAGSFFFFDQNGQTIPAWKTLQDRIPPIKQKIVSAISDATAQLLQKATNSLMAGNFVMNLVLSASLQQLWTMVNTQQIIVMMPLFRVSLPPDAQLFFGFVMQLAAFNLLPTDLFYDTYFSLMKQAETGPINENFEADGFGSHYFIYNMGTLMVAILSLPLLVVLNYIFKFLSKKSQRIQKVYLKLTNYLFWSHQITVVFESYSMVILSAFINTLHMTYGSYGEILSSVMTIVFYILCVALPFIFGIFMIIKFPILGQELMKKKFGSMYANLDLRKGRWIALIPFNFLVRRFLIGVSVVYQNHIIIQVLAVLFGVFIEIAVNGSINPYDEQFLQRNAFFNEIIIVTTMYSFMCFTDFSTDLEAKRFMGYAACLTVFIHLGVNIFFMLKESLHRTVLKLKRWYVRRKTLKNGQKVKTFNTTQDNLESSSVKISRKKIVDNSTNQLVIEEDRAAEVSLEQELKLNAQRQEANNFEAQLNQQIDSHIQVEEDAAQKTESQAVDWDEFMAKMNAQQRQDNHELQLARAERLRNPAVPPSSQALADAEERKLLRKAKMEQAIIAQNKLAEKEIDGRTPSQRLIDELFPANFQLEQTANEYKLATKQTELIPNDNDGIENQFFYSDARVEFQADQLEKYLNEKLAKFQPKLKDKRPKLI